MTDLHSSKGASPKLWGGRFTGTTDPLMDRLNASLPFDWRLWDADIAGSVAWARATCRAGLLTEEERDTLIAGLEAVRAEIARDPAAAFARASDEDIHSFVERRLTEQVGPVAGKLHTGRSRNDQIATDVRLWLREMSGGLDAALTGLIRAATGRAEAEIDLLMPGYTHVQPAQPVRWSHWLLSHAWAWQRDRERLADLSKRVNVLPLGAGALAGCPFAINRERLATDLGFASASPNSLDAVSDRDFVAEFLFWAALLGVHLSRWAEDLVFWSSREFGFITLADAYSTGSSLMPQKKNPDAAELLRGKAGRLVGGLTSLLVTLKGLPSSYDKDLQEDKEPLFDAVETLSVALPVAQGILETLAVHPERMRGALGDELLATDLADWLVRRGRPLPPEPSPGGASRASRRGARLCAERTAPGRASGHQPALLRRSLVGLGYGAVSGAARVTGGTARSAVEAQIAALRRACE